MTPSYPQSDISEMDTYPNVFLERFDIGSGPLTIGVKDVVDIEGYPTRLASDAFKDAPAATHNAEIIDRLLQGGAKLVGKTNMHELAYGVTGLNQRYGTPPNPNFPGLIPGGSSSGSATAVAAGLCDGAIGTDTGGSIRVPAACCGVLGLKPTFGRVSRKGLTPANSSLDCVGPFARDSATLDAIMAMIAPDWVTTDRGQALNVKWLKSRAEPGIWSASYEAAQALHPELEQAEAPSLEAAHRAGLTIIAKETYAAFGHLIEGGQIDPEVAARLARAPSIPDAEVQQAIDIKETFISEIDTLLQSCDVLALPTLAGYPPHQDNAADLMAMVEITALCRPFNLSGHPAISIPLPPLSGQPVSLQLVAGKGRDEDLVALAAHYEQLMNSTPLNRSETC